MDRRIKKVLRDIIKDKNPELCFGDAIASHFFKEDQCALLIDGDNHSCQILLKKSSQVRNTILTLTELLGTMNHLEKEASVLLLEGIQQGGLDLYYEGKQDFAEAMLPGKYVLSSKSQLTYLDGQPAQIDEALFGVHLPDPLVDSFLRLFRAKVFPTAALVRYISHGFKTDAQFDTMRALWLNRIAIIVAILLGLSPFIGRKRDSDSRLDNQYEAIHSQDTLHTTR